MSQSLKSFVCSAPGKVILFGEHAVVLGKTSIATALGLRTYALFEEYEITTEDQPAITLELPDLSVNRQWTKRQLESLYNHPAIPANLQALGSVLIHYGIHSFRDDLI
jgi:mevalonate kinase